jgi:hypothetical protein
MKHAIRQSPTGRTRQVVVDDDRRCATRGPGHISWHSIGGIRVWLQAKHDRLDALGYRIIDRNHFNTSGATASRNGDAAGQGDIVQPVRSGAANRIIDRQLRVSRSAPTHHKHRGVRARTVVRPCRGVRVPGCGSYVPIASVPGSGPPPVARTEGAFDGNWIARNNRYHGHISTGR